ncbi:MAG: hypothetical protein WDZ51_13880 [Pirellulaceae bacterium]
MKQGITSLAITAWVLAVTVTQGASVEELATAIKSVDREAAGHPQAMAAIAELGQLHSDRLPKILEQFDGANPLAANWLRAGVEMVADKAVSEGKSLPVAKLVTLLREDQLDPRARLVAFELVERVAPQKASALIPGFAQDRSLELRRMAVAQKLAEADKLSKSEAKDEAIATYQAALDASRDEDQVKVAANQLKKLGAEVDLQKHFGLLANWHIVAPFDYDGGEGFNTAYEPENQVDLQATYNGKKVKEVEGPVQWKEFVAQDDQAWIDFNAAYAPVKEVVGYAYTTVDSAKNQTVQFRWASLNANKVWVNGEEVAANRVYHAGSQFDQYRAIVDLKEGENRILVKVVQNDQTQDWTNIWRFQLRICDALGTPVPGIK